MNQVLIVLPFLHPLEVHVQLVIIQQKEVQHALQSNVTLGYMTATATLWMAVNLALIARRQLQLFKASVQLAAVRRHVQQ